MDEVGRRGRFVQEDLASRQPRASWKKYVVGGIVGLAVGAILCDHETRTIVRIGSPPPPSEKPCEHH
jgi:hypothetical protein